MTNRLTDRYDVERVRFTRDQPRDEAGRDLLGAVDGLLPDGSVFHVFADTPDDTGDLLIILVDGATVVRFELPRVTFGRDRVTGGLPRDVLIEPLEDYRRNSGQEGRKTIDRAVEDARRILSER